MRQTSGENTGGGEGEGLSESGETSAELIHFGVSSHLLTGAVLKNIMANNISLSQAFRAEAPS